MGNPDLLFSFLRYISTLKAILPNQQGASCWIPQYSLRPHPHPFVQADNSHSYSRSETLLLPPTTHKWTHSFTLRGAQVLIYRRHSLYSILSNSYILILTGTFSGLQLPQFADLQSLLRLIHGTGRVGRAAPQVLLAPGIKAAALQIREWPWSYLCTNHRNSLHVTFYKVLLKTKVSS